MAEEVGSGRREGDVDRLVREGLPLVEMIARRVSRMLGGRIDIDDLKAFGRGALLEAARTYDPTRARFDTYASLKIKWAMIDGVRRETHGRAIVARAKALAASERVGAEMAAESPPSELPSEEAYRDRLRTLLQGHAAALAVGFIASAGDMAFVADAIDSPEELVIRGEMARTLEHAVAKLPDREQALVQRHYFGEEQFDAIAQDLGISKSWASRLHAQAITALGKALRRRKASALSSGSSSTSSRPPARPR